jgi:hypothetical protein
LFCFSCPFDYVKVYDGPHNESAVIGTYCGQQRNLVLYSSESSLLVTFVTIPRTANTQNRGFKGIFEFSESFVKLGMFLVNYLLSWFSPQPNGLRMMERNDYLLETYILKSKV